MGNLGRCTGSLQPVAMSWSRLCGRLLGQASNSTGTVTQTDSRPDTQAAAGTVSMLLIRSLLTSRDAEEPGRCWDLSSGKHGGILQWPGGPGMQGQASSGSGVGPFSRWGQAGPEAGARHPSWALGREGTGWQAEARRGPSTPTTQAGTKPAQLKAANHPVHTTAFTIQTLA